MTDLDVTAPDLENMGNGVDAVECCNTLSSNGNTLVAQLQVSGHMLLGLNTLLATSGKECFEL